MNPIVGEIWLTKFHPGTGVELSKYRPAVIISGFKNIDDRFCLVAPLTTDTKIRNEFELTIKNSGLDETSLLLAWYLRTIDKRRLIQKLGTLSTKETELVLQTAVEVIKQKQ